MQIRWTNVLYRQLIVFNRERDRIVYIRQIHIDDYLDMETPQRDLTIDEDVHIRDAAWTLTATQRTINKILSLEEEQAKRTDDLISTPTSALRSHQD
jgi:hypothetical protein